MANRREFLQGGSAVAAAAAPVGALLAGGLAAMPLYKVVFDQRYPDSVAFGAHAKALGLDAHAIRGDVTSLWYDDLYHRWRRSPAPIAGLTNHSALFCLEMMAADVGMRLIYRGNHRSQPNGEVSHEVFGPSVAQRRETELRAAGGNWGRKAAQLVAAWPADLAMIAKRHSNIADAGMRSLAPDALTSWIIAPVRRT